MLGLSLEDGAIQRLRLAHLALPVQGEGLIETPSSGHDPAHAN
jgi:hypothetical protein